jgi:hypothetical protein
MEHGYDFDRPEAELDSNNCVSGLMHTRGVSSTFFDGN